MNLRYFSGNQEIQREAILECCGSAPRTWEDDDGNVHTDVTSSRLEAEFLLSQAEERAKNNLRHAIPVSIAGTVYRVLAK